jgi:hypothetical protein
MAGIPREAVFGRGLVSPSSDLLSQISLFHFFRAVGMRKETPVNVRFPASLAGMLSRQVTQKKRPKLY